ncbi:hypothetical protein ALI144C_46810 [Actinosynnema sp. ALI-1.44]|uniref:hypothetical protein n=1 Tax=Actinosynnema sp. ALI-1.44 TaxID=1933779 RepID=UPI00097CB6DB|nr:hypothetical protein [Actinosynnema sp. ALI-1.44]ONI73414.1 hypothetical protein ALI144C_46810 [Actinosynnema sp. ALI-1.44]
MTTANTENEDLQGLVKPKQGENTRSQAGAQQTEVVDSSGGALPADPKVTTDDGGYHHDTGPVGVLPRPTGGYHHDGTPVDPEPEPEPQPEPRVRPTGGYHHDSVPTTSTNS